MIRARALAISVFGVLLTAYPLHAQEISRYREVEMGNPLLSVAGLSGLTPADAKVILAILPSFRIWNGGCGAP